MSSELDGVRARIKKNVPEPMFTRCYVCKLNLVLLHSAKGIPEGKAFFKTLARLSAYFCKLTKRTH